MTAIRTILVPLDGSRFSEQALPLAAEIAARSGASLHIARVHEPPAAWATAMELPLVALEVDQELRQRERAYLDSISGQVLKDYRFTASPALLDGPIASALEAHAQTVQADLIVMSTHGRNAIGRFWLGSVADKLTRRVRTPVLLVRPGEHGESPAPSIAKVLIALDGSRFSEGILDWTLKLGGLFGAEYELLTVIPGAEGLVNSEVVDAMPALLQLEREEREAAERYLDGMESRLREEGYAVSSRIISGPPVHVAIAREAEHLRADIIAMATHGATGVERLLVGSVTDRVLRAGGRPVLVVRPERVPAGRNHLTASVPS